MKSTFLFLMITALGQFADASSQSFVCSVFVGAEGIRRIDVQVEASTYASIGTFGGTEVKLSAVNDATMLILSEVVNNQTVRTTVVGRDYYAYVHRSTDAQPGNSLTVTCRGR